MQVGWSKIGDFRQIADDMSKTVQDSHIVSIKVEYEVGRTLGIKLYNYLEYTWLLQQRSMTQALSTSYARIPFNSQQILNGLAFNFQRNVVDNAIRCW